MRFYERTLGGKLEILMTHAESPMAAQTPPGSADRILHARLVIDGRMLMASDAMVGQPYQGMNGFSLSLVYPKVADAKRYSKPWQGREGDHAVPENFWSKPSACWSTASARPG